MKTVLFSVPICNRKNRIFRQKLRFDYKQCSKCNTLS